MSNRPETGNKPSGLEVDSSEYEKEENPNNSSEGIRVLIVDDEPDVCFLVRSIVRSQGFETEVAHSVSDCMSKMEKFTPSFVILDINLPDGNGLELLQTLRDSWSDARVIMHSALDVAENRELAEKRGAIGFLAKPVDKKALLAYLRS